jgi:DNA processing protein
VVEAARRSGALNTARHARDQGRPLMAVPGPVTSTLSAGCHEIIRDWGAVCVTGAWDVMEVLSFPGDEPPGRARGPVLPRDALDPATRQVLEAVPARAGRGPGQDRGGGRCRFRHGHALPRHARGGWLRRAQ